MLISQFYTYVMLILYFYLYPIYIGLPRGTFSSEILEHQYNLEIIVV